MGKLFDLLQEHRHRAGSGDRVMLVCWKDLDKKAVCCGAIGDTMLEQKPGESFESYTDRVVASAKTSGTIVVFLQNLYVIDRPEDGWRTPRRLYYGLKADRDKVHRPSHQVGHPIRWQ